MSELKPCPFCNAKPKQHNKLYMHVRHEEWCALAANGERNEVYNIEAWNTRVERTCAVTGVEYDKTMGACFDLSCGHSTWHDGDGNAPGYCQDCGRMIRA